MICTCSCGRVYWKYAGAQPIGYCSWLCWQNRDKREKLSRGIDPEEPLAVLQDIREHNRIKHGVASATYQELGCEECEHLDFRYAEALHNVRVA